MQKQTEVFMVTLVYLAAYLGTIACVAMVALKVMNYLKKPPHVRWELYPVGHETTQRLAYGGSFREDVDWWKNQRQTSLCNSIKVMATEVLLLHATFEHNKPLWSRTYPFHLGLYFLLGGFFLTVFAALAQLVGVEPGVFLTAVGNLVQVFSLLGFIGVIGGAAALIHRRLKQEDLRKYSTREHFFNLGAFLVLGLVGLLAWLGNPSFFALGRDFIASMLSFQFADPGSVMFSLYIILGFMLAAYVPASHMGHFFMKYFLYHDIRWDDRPTKNNPNMLKKIEEGLNYTVSWNAPHIKGDGQKTWTEVAATNPTANPADGKN